MRVWRTAAYALALAAFVATSATAQNKKDKGKGKESTCDLGIGDDATLEDAQKTLTVAQLGGKAEEQTKRLQGVVKSLEKPEKFKSSAQPGRNYLLGQTLVTWMARPGMSGTVKRGDVGYTSNSDGQIDLLAATDTALNAVETAKPDCKAEADALRQQPWGKIIYQVPVLLNRNQPDSAEMALQRSLVIYRTSPYTYYFAGNIAQKKGDWAGVTQAFGKVVELTPPDVIAKDTTLNQVREFSLFSTAYGHMKQGNGATGDAQKQQYATATDGFKQYLKEYPSGPNAQNATNLVTSLLGQSGDTAAVSALWQQMLANPAKYDHLQFFDAGVDAFQTNKKPIAAQLFEAGLQQNPSYRTGLYNLANTYRALGQPDKEVPIVQRLIAVDPTNPDNYQLLALAYSEVAKTTTDPKLKKARQDSVAVMLARSDSLPARVTFKQFTHEGNKHTLAGEVENLRKTPLTATVAFQFLDKSGATVDTASVAINAAPSEKTPFTVKVTHDGVVAFKYAPLPLVAAKKAGA